MRACFAKDRGDGALGAVVADGAGEAIGLKATPGDISIGPSWAVGGGQGTGQAILSFWTEEVGLGNIRLCQRRPVAEDTWGTVDAFADNH